MNYFLKKKNKLQILLQTYFLAVIFISELMFLINKFGVSFDISYNPFYQISITLISTK